MSTWTEELKAKAIEMYNEGEPTADNSVEIVKEIAEELSQSPNGVRMILTKAGVYIKKTPATKAATAAPEKSGGTRVSKEAAHSRLIEVIEKTNQNPDNEIISKLTGKAALYFAEIFESVISEKN